MRRNQLADLSAFATVAEERSFTRAAVRLDMSASALSHSVKALENRLGVRLLTRTTRSVAPTAAGERLLCALVPAFSSVAEALAELGAQRDVPAGNVRLTAVKHAACNVLAGVLPGFLDRFPDIAVEVVAEDRMADIVSEGFDAGIRLGERVAKDMVSVRIGAEVPTAVVGAPAYFDRFPPPATPYELTTHQCIGHRMGTGALHAWPFSERGRDFSVKVSGRLVHNDADLILEAALAGGGLAYLFADQVEPFVSDGRLVRVLDEWTKTHAGYFLYYPSRRRQPPALAALVDWLRCATLPARS